MGMSIDIGNGSPYVNWYAPCVATPRVLPARHPTPFEPFHSNDPPGSSQTLQVPPRSHQGTRRIERREGHIRA